MKTVSILGSTGSIGTQTLTVIERLGYRVGALSAGSNIELLEQQARKFRPEFVSVYDEELAGKLASSLRDIGIKVLSGTEGNCAVACCPSSDIVITAMSGMIGLVPTVEAIKAKKTIGLANKETLVCAGKLIMSLAKEYGVSIYPVDSEHSAIFQCLEGHQHQKVNRLILTASGGPFRGYSKEELSMVTKEQALRHPNWSMGAKITIDSASMMNKGLEVIEARWLFDIPLEQIDVAVHPQSIVHSMVEFEDHSIIAQLGIPSMELPIQYALTYPQRVKTPETLGLDLFEKPLTFERVDEDTFECLALCRKALSMDGLAPCVVNAAGETAVSLFLQDKIAFSQIPWVIKSALNVYDNKRREYTLEDVLETDRKTRQFVLGNLFS